MCTPSSVDGRRRDEAAIRALEMAYDSAWNNGDVQRLVAAFAPEAVVVNPLGKSAKGRAEIQRVLGEFLNGPAKGSRHTSDVATIEFITDDVAVVDGKATVEGMAEPGDTTPAPAVHRFTDIVVRRHGTWTIAHVRAYLFAQPPRR
jgi:uncharacterized protein (TIGR02246 family)